MCCFFSGCSDHYRLKAVFIKVAEAHFTEKHVGAVNETRFNWFWLRQKQEEKCVTLSLNNYFQRFADLVHSADIPHGGFNNLRSTNLTGLNI